MAVLQPGPERDTQTVDLGAHATVANAGVDAIGIIERRCPARQLDHVPLGREAEDLIGIHLKLHMLEELVVIGLVETLGQGLNPFRRINGKRVLGAHAILIGPMRRHTGFGNLVHLAGSDLHLHLFAVAA